MCAFFSNECSQLKALKLQVIMDGSQNRKMTRLQTATISLSSTASHPSVNNKSMMQYSNCTGCLLLFNVPQGWGPRFYHSWSSPHPVISILPPPEGHGHTINPPLINPSPPRPMDLGHALFAEDAFCLPPSWT